ncbi:MAG: hypothetical protein IJM13_06640, partial [Lachnospiraceae bacterium]|nr:hypothetical protein [Lachnospiraceae bacterium]
MYKNANNKKIINSDEGIWQAAFLTFLKAPPACRSAFSHPRQPETQILMKNPPEHENTFGREKHLSYGRRHAGITISRNFFILGVIY